MVTQAFHFFFIFIAKKLGLYYIFHEILMWFCWADCCDGSDEYSGKIKCKNTCWEAGKVARQRLTKKIATFQEGLTIRKHDVEQAKISVAKDEAELSRLKEEENILKGLVQQLKGTLFFHQNYPSLIKL